MISSNELNSVAGEPDCGIFFFWDTEPTVRKNSKKKDEKLNEYKRNGILLYYDTSVIHVPLHFSVVQISA